ncbi:MAG: bifunctional diaminohydroxyphosphoribosylaminopyrimidine deaminase/5-amino-6-(5-phosphoribosylamino)uracil reductase RibD [Clostridiales bacterium]|nr:bifunctional diaminohydroxyphosphoribosylaminopyrimidine deaminase/5-amino-6-(5-phosphoribosylamino)uracil reductase RibD [Clostridiales bacterium]
MRLFSDVSSTVADPHLRRAYQLAERGRGRTAPNPMVGCVLVRDGVVIGEGYHESEGGPHAEIAALRSAGRMAHGADAYVTLEPCAHHGRTPPCADALIAARVARVFIGMPDPTPLAQGGARRLAEAGVEVTFADDPAPFETLNDPWLTRVASGLPWVQVKVASSLDGALTLADGIRSEITGPGGLAVTMRLRAAADAVLVGARTAEIDKPTLTVRDSDGIDAPHQPLRIVLARDHVPAMVPLFDDARGPVALACHARTAVSGPPETVRLLEYLPSEGVSGALKAIAHCGVDRLLVEAGPRLLTALWDGDLIDELVIVHAGGMAGVSAPGMYLGDVGNVASRLTRPMYAVESGVAGTDAVSVWRPKERREGVAGKEGR